MNECSGTINGRNTQERYTGSTPKVILVGDLTWYRLREEMKDMYRYKDLTGADLDIIEFHGIRVYKMSECVEVY